MTGASILERIERGLHAASATGREVVQADGFVVYLSTVVDHPHMSVAIPTSPPGTDLAGGLDGVRRAFEARGRTPRIEYLRDLHPELEAAALATGFVRDMAADVMVLHRSRLTAAPAMASTYRRFEVGDRARVEAALRGADRAFRGSDDGGGLDWLPVLLHGLARGSILGGAVDEGGRPVAGATVLIGGDVGELAGVWSSPEHRRRGLARQACHALLTEFFARGFDLAWLSASEGAVQLYAGLGFERVGTQVNLQRPRAA